MQLTRTGLALAPMLDAGGLQGDGSVRGEFNAANPRDTGLLDRMSRSYDRRMGR